ncbi:hypothetical protein NQ318_017888 [Aromia moschata]|uniref:Uncharacterized protein n=1 Tax=Aromia moschata TaxID=1265417 RepID=A0AAV8YBU0_9CUCU|nr:hypothetical protein NQ318_017888 [Aromia moschata]
MLSVQMEQRVNLKFLVELGKTFTEAYALLKQERKATEDGPRPGRPSTSKTDENISKLVSKSAKIEVLTALRERVRRRKPDLWKTKSWKIHQDNAPPHFCFVCEGVKSALKGTRFESVEAVKAKATKVLNQLTEADFQHCFQQLKHRMERCRDRQGEYIEGEKVSTVIDNE